MEAYSNSHQFNLSTGQVIKNVASPAQNEPVIGLEDRLLLTRWLHTNGAVRLDATKVYSAEKKQKA